MGKDNIQVVIRIRPLLSHEAGQNLSVVPPTKNNEISISDPDSGDSQKYKFNHCFWSLDIAKDREIETNEHVYKKLGVQVIENMENGFNSTVFAYGQTGSGKSFSIEGSSSDHGLLKRVCEHLFNYKQEVELKHDGNDVDVEVSYLEIYNETLRDLLDTNKKDLKIFALDKEVVVKNLEKLP